MRIRAVLALSLLLLLVAAPVAAASAYDFTGLYLNILDIGKQESKSYGAVTSITFDTSKEGKAINNIDIKVPAGEHINFTLYYGDSHTVTGSAQASTRDLWGYTTIWLTFDGTTRSYKYWDVDPATDTTFSGYARERSTNNTGFVYYHSTYGILDDDLLIFKEVDPLSTNLIHKIVITSSAPTSVKIWYAPMGTVAGVAAKSWWDMINDLMNWATTVFDMVLNLAITLVKWIKFLFIDNLGLIVALYLSITLAMAMNGTGDFFARLRRWVRYQKALYEFIVSMYHRLVDLVATFRSIFF